MVVLLQQSVPPIYETCCSKKYSMKLRLLSRTWPNISKLEHTVYKKVQMAESYQNTKNLEKTKKQFQRVLAGTPPSKESRNIVFFCFSKVFTKCGVLQGNWHESQAKLSKCLGECSKTSQNIILNHGKTALPGAAVLQKKAKKHHEWINDSQTHANESN